MTQITEQRVYEWLADVTDPEVPVKCQLRSMVKMFL